MHQIGLHAHRQVAANSTGCGLARLRNAAQHADRVHTIDPFPAAGDNGCAAHKSLDFSEEVASLQMNVVVVKEFIAQSHHLHTHQLQPLALEDVDQFSYQVALNRVWFD